MPVRLVSSWKIRIRMTGHGLTSPIRQSSRPRFRSTCQIARHSPATVGSVPFPVLVMVDPYYPREAPDA
jgi:hypothetical protein